MSPWPAPKPLPCGMCGGSGRVPVDPKDRRKGERTCPNCGGNGEL